MERIHTDAEQDQLAASGTEEDLATLKESLRPLVDHLVASAAARSDVPPSELEAVAWSAFDRALAKHLEDRRYHFGTCFSWEARQAISARGRITTDQ